MSKESDIFEEAWKIKEAEGFQYGPEEREHVRLGWDMAVEEAAKTVERASSYFLLSVSVEHATLKLKDVARVIRKLSTIKVRS